MSRNSSISPLLIILFSGLICFYYIIPRGWAYLFEAFILLLAIKEKSGKFDPVPVIWYSLFSMYIIIDAVFRDHQMIYVSSCLNVLVFILILSLLIKSEEQSNLFIKASAFFGVAFSLYILVKFRVFIGIGRLGMELPGTRIDSAITLGYIFLYFMCLQILSLVNFQLSIVTKIVLVLGLSLSMYLTLMTGTRKALYIPILYLFLVIILKNRLYFGRLLFYISTLSIITVVSFNFMLENEIISSDSLTRMEGSLAIISDKYAMDDSTIERELLAYKATNIFYQHPLLGNGTDQVLKELTKHPHNNFLSILSMGGLVMFVFYYWIYFVCLFSKTVNRNKYLPLFMIVVFVLPLSDLGTTSFNIIYFNILIALFVLTAKQIELRKKLECCDSLSSESF